MATPEGKIKGLVKAALKLIKRIYWFMPVAGTYGRAGIPDFILCVPTKITPDMVGRTIGAFVAIETKAEDGTYGLTKLQAYNLELISDAGGVGYVVDSKAKFEQVLLDLKQHGAVLELK